MALKALLAFACLSFTVACSDLTNTPGVTQVSTADYDALDDDPLEPLNRGFFRTHQALDTVVFRPVSEVYTGLMPEPGRKAVSNFLDNINAPVNLANSIMQGDVENSFATFWRFVLNSTFGLAGIYDFAGKEVGLKARDADFGQTLAHYGVPSGIYIFLPLLGPTTVRDGTGWGVDVLLDPVTWTEDNTWSVAKWVTTGIDYRSQNLKVINDLYDNSIDPYSAFRSAWLQHRAKEIREGLDR